MTAGHEVSIVHEIIPGIPKSKATYMNLHDGYDNSKAMYTQGIMHDGYH